MSTKPSTDNLDREFADMLKRPSVVMRDVVQMRPTVSQRSALEHAAGWIRSLRYEDMMQMAAEMHGIKAADSVDTPEQLAKLLHSWAKATTEPRGGDGRDG